jgi:hypothetical protein
MKRLRHLWARPHALLLSGEGLWAPGQGGKAYADFGAWCAAHAGQACELWTGASVLAEVAGSDAATTRALRAPAARLAWARRVLHHYHGEAAALWPLLPWPAAGAWGASALRGLVLAELQAQAQAHGVVLRAVRPLWPQLLAQLLAQQPALRRSAVGQAWLIEAGPTRAGQADAGPTAPAQAAAGAAHLTRVGLAQGRVVSVQRRRLQAPWAASLQRLLDEEPPATGVTPALLWLGPAPQVSLPLPPAITLLPPYREALPPGAGGRPDFLHPQPRPGLLAWAWLCTCAAVLALAAADAREAWALRAQVQALVMPAAAPRVAAAPVLPMDPAELALRQRLQHPWPAVFLASEAPATAGLRWLSLDHRAGAELRLQGLASDAAPVQLAAAALRQQRAWQQVLVARLEALPPGPAGGAGQGPPLPMSFEIVARLREATP